MAVLVDKTWRVGPLTNLSGGMVRYKETEREFAVELQQALIKIRNECVYLLDQHRGEKHKSVHIWMVDESCYNAVGHGNGLDHRKVVQVQLRIEEVAEQLPRVLSVMLSVADQGTLFEIPTSIGSDHDNYGRGLPTLIELLRRRRIQPTIEVTPVPPTGAASGKSVVIAWEEQLPL